MLSVILSSFSQPTSGLITYSMYKEVNISEGDKPENSDPGYEKFVKEVEKKMLELQFELIFNQTSSKFSLVDGLHVDQDNPITRVAVGAIGGKKIVYSDLNRRLLIEERQFLNEKFIVGTPLDKIEWTLTDQTKVISGYVCYKAIGSEEFFERNGKMQKSPLIAWCCPDLPYPFGPFQAVNLPGLVLELHSGNGRLIFLANDINLNIPPPVISIPEEKQMITKKDFDKILSEKAREIKYK